MTTAAKTFRSVPLLIGRHEFLEVIESESPFELGLWPGLTTLYGYSRHNPDDLPLGWLAKDMFSGQIVASGLKSLPEARAATA